MSESQYAAVVRSIRGEDDDDARGDLWRTVTAQADTIRHQQAAIETQRATIETLTRMAAAWKRAATAHIERIKRMTEAGR